MGNDYLPNTDFKTGNKIVKIYRGDTYWGNYLNSVVNPNTAFNYNPGNSVLRDLGTAVSPAVAWTTQSSVWNNGGKIIWDTGVDALKGMIGISDNMSSFLSDTLKGNLSNSFNVDKSVGLIETSDSWTLRPIKNNFGEVLPSAVTNLVNKGGTVANAIAISSSFLTGNEAGSNFRMNPWWKDIKGWTGTDPISYTASFEFKMGQYGLWSAKEEVVKPMLNLISMSTPQILNNTGSVGPFPTPGGMLAKMISSVIESSWGTVSTTWGTVSTTFERASGQASAIYANSLDDEFDPESYKMYEYGKATAESQQAPEITPTKVLSLLATLTEKTLSGIVDSLLEIIKKNTFKIQLGNFITLQNCVCEELNNISFSKEVDQYGYPISAKISLTFKGYTPPALNTSKEALLAIRFGGNS